MRHLVFVAGRNVESAINLARVVGVELFVDDGEGGFELVVYVLGQADVYAYTVVVVEHYARKIGDVEALYLVYAVFLKAFCNAVEYFGNAVVLKFDVFALLQVFGAVADKLHKVVGVLRGGVEHSAL